MTDEFRSGFVALVGRPNVGKSTLLNAFLSQKISIVTPKPQTTRHRVLGIKTLNEYQIVFVDTPGIHDSGRRLINKNMNRMAITALDDSDVIVFVIEALKWTAEDEALRNRLLTCRQPILIACNKIDRINQKVDLLPFLKTLDEKLPGVEVIPLSALKDDGLSLLEKQLVAHLPVSPQLFPGDQVTDRGEEFLIAELIREKLTLRLQQELPYGITVSIEKIERDKKGMAINAIVWVEREGQKAIVIGKAGAMLKEVGRATRLELKRKFGCPVHIELWTKVKDNWSDNAQALRSFGYDHK